MELQGSIGILTGASRGLGVYFAEALARRGVNLALAARSAEELERTAEMARDFGVKTISVPTDVGKLKDLTTLVERTTDELGPVDLLVNNAGIERYVEYQDVDLELIEKILRINVWAPEVLTRLVLPGMVERRRGHVVNIASVAGKTAVPYNTIYSSSKHALVGFSWSLREEMKRYGVGVSVVCPGFVSDAGMFADWSHGMKPPGLTRSVAPGKVAEELIAAIDKNKAEVIVAKGLTKIVDVTHAVSPELTTSLGRASGVYEFLNKATSSRFKS